MEGNLPENALLRIPIRVVTDVLGDGLLTYGGAVPTLGAADVAGPAYSDTLANMTASVAVYGLVPVRVVAGISNAALGSPIAAAAGGRAKVAATGEFVIGRLMDAIGATATLADQRVRILITKEGRQP